MTLEGWLTILDIDDGVIVAVIDEFSSYRGVRLAIAIRILTYICPSTFCGLERHNTSSYVGRSPYSAVNCPRLPRGRNIVPKFKFHQPKFISLGVLEGFFDLRNTLSWSR
jgi:hypothetical protein